MNPEPSAEHQWLQRLVGDWTYEMREQTEAGLGEVQSRGMETVRKVGDLWVQADMHENHEAGDHHAVMTLGYDPAIGKFVGTFVSSMITKLWLYEGTLDAAANRLTLDSEGPDMSDDGTTARYHDIIELTVDGGRVLRSEMEGKDGTWREFMKQEYRRA